MLTVGRSSDLFIKGHDQIGSYFIGHDSTTRLNDCGSAGLKICFSHVESWKNEICTVEG